MRKGMLKKMIKEDLVAIRNGAFITPILDKILRMVGCDKCFGKGYGTKTEFASTGLGDFFGDNAKPRTWKLPEIEFCNCGRGQQLKKLFREKYEHI